MWPFTLSTQGLYLALYLLAWALHAVFVGYVAAGTGFALFGKGELAIRVRDRLPFMLGCGITAGVGPLLFVQLLYQRRFYTANLLLGPRWMLVVPALIAGFYALYLAKVAKPKLRRAALAVGLGAFVFVAYSWSELHALEMNEKIWRDFYAAGHRVYFEGALPIRVAMWLGGAVVMFATVAVWSAEAAERSRLALLAIGGIVVAAIGAFALGTNDAHGWQYILIAAALVSLAGFALVVRAPDGPGLLVATSGVSAAVFAAAVVREAPRIALIETPRAESGGLGVFAITFVFGVAAIMWVLRTVRS